MPAPVDLRELAFNRQPPPNAVAPRLGRRRWLTRFLIPAVILASFLGVIGWTLRDELLPGTSVTVIPVVASRSKVERSNEPLFPAAGWVEPRPSPIVVTSMLEGVVERIEVIEGQEVTAGQPVAYLVRKDSEIAIRQAESELQLKTAEKASAEAQLASAKTYFDEPIQRQAQLAEAEAHLAKVQTELSRMPSLQRAAQARARQASSEFEIRAKSKDVNGRLAVERAQSELQVTQASVDELQEQAKSLEQERVALARRRDVLKRMLDLKIDEKRLLAEAEASVNAADARRMQGQASLEAAHLRLERTTITAPINGKVLALVAKPGSKLMGLERAAMLDASTVITMYDPQQLQIRADVRLEDLPRVLVGQPVRIETPAVSGTLSGRVINMTSVADIQKNTLQVKVAVDQPPEMLRPDMLVQVTFLAPPQPSSAGQTESQLRLTIPRSLVQTVGEQSAVWIIDAATQRATQRVIVPGVALEGDLVEVISGLHVGDRLIVKGRDSLREGSRIQNKGEDRTLGRNPSDSGAADQPSGPGNQSPIKSKQSN